MADTGSTVKVQRREGPPSCSYCREPCTEAQDPSCDACRAAYHADCLAELGACATIGCAAPRPAPRPAPRVGPRPAHGTTGGDVASRVTVRPRIAGDGGPRVGSERTCTQCPSVFRVEAATRYSPFCPACRAQHNGRGVVVALLLLAVYMALVFGPAILGALVAAVRGN